MWYIVHTGDYQMIPSAELALVNNQPSLGLTFFAHGHQPFSSLGSQCQAFQSTRSRFTMSGMRYLRITNNAAAFGRYRKIPGPERKSRLRVQWMTSNNLNLSNHLGRSLVSLLSFTYSKPFRNQPSERKLFHAKTARNASFTACNKRTRRRPGL